MNWLWESLYLAAMMAWETFWALVLGFAVSAALQAFVSKERMAGLFGRTNLRSMALATGFGAASSSCSYAAAAAARSAFVGGAALVPALAFMFASTNLVVELGAVLWLLMGWRFVAAELLGSFVLIGLMWALVRLVFPKSLEEEARKNADGDAGDGGCCHHAGSARDHGHGGDRSHGGRWQRLAGGFVMDWQMLWKEIAVGFLIAGFLSALVPADGWKVLFLNGGPAWLRLIENAVVGPLIAVASFACSVGNIPLASLLWSGGISFGGVISFIYADLIIFPLLAIYRKYYGLRAAAYIAAVFFASMVGAGIIVDMLFNLLGWIPTDPRPMNAMVHARFAWNYTTWLDIAALFFGGWLVWLHTRASGEDHSMDDPGHVHGEHVHHHENGVR